MGDDHLVIALSEVRQALDRLLAAAAGELGSSIDLDADQYWWIDTQARGYRTGPLPIRGILRVAGRWPTRRPPVFEPGDGRRVRPLHLRMAQSA